MTQTEFDYTEFHKGMSAMYLESEYRILAVDFEDRTLMLIRHGIEQWVEYGKVTLI